MREEHELNQNKAPIYEALQKFRQMPGLCLLMCLDINGAGESGADRILRGALHQH